MLKSVMIGRALEAGVCKTPLIPYLAFLLEETARKILPEAVLTCCVSGNIHMGCGYYKWGSCDVIRYSDIDAASVCIGSLVW